jgi:small subunit ribosomal protein S9
MVDNEEKEVVQPGKREKGRSEKKGKILITVGKRKRAIARAKFEPGKGIIKINKTPLDLISNEITRMKIREPLLIVGNGWKGYNIHLNVRGGGIMGQADAARQAIAKGLVQLLGGETKKKIMDYDKYMLVADSRRTEPHKPPRSSQGPRRYKQRSKR